MTYIPKHAKPERAIEAYNEASVKDIPEKELPDGNTLEGDPQDEPDLTWQETTTDGANEHGYCEKHGAVTVVNQGHNSGFVGEGVDWWEYSCGCHGMETGAVERWMIE